MKRIIKAAAALIAALMLAVSLCSCGSSGPAYTGTWTINNIMGGKTTLDQVNGTLIMNEDGSFSWELVSPEDNSGSTLSGTYAVSEDETTIQFSGNKVVTREKNGNTTSKDLETEMSLEGTMISNDTMKVTGGMGDQVVELKKK